MPIDSKCVSESHKTKMAPSSNSNLSHSLQVWFFSGYEIQTQHFCNPSTNPKLYKTRYRVHIMYFSALCLPSIALYSEVSYLSVFAAYCWVVREQIAIISYFLGLPFYFTLFFRRQTHIGGSALPSIAYHTVSCLLRGIFARCYYTPRITFYLPFFVCTFRFRRLFGDTNRHETTGTNILGGFISI